MLRLRFFGLLCCAAWSLNPARAEPVKPEIINAPAAAVSDTKPAAGVETPAVKGEDKPAINVEAVKPADVAKPIDSAKPPDTQEPEKFEKAAEAAKPVPPPEPTLTAAINLGSQVMTVSENGARKYSWAISSGTSEHPTPRGTFRPQWTAKMWYSKKYDNAPMPNAVFVSGGVAIHATYATGMLGRPASHGCIRLSPANAATFYKLVGRHGLKMTKVSIYGTPKWRSPAVARNGDDERSSRFAARQPQQQVQQRRPSNSWFWETPSYRTTSVPERTYRRPPPPRGYYYADEGPPRGYRRANAGERVYYMQRPRYYDRYSGW